MTLMTQRRRPRFLTYWAWKLWVFAGIVGAFYVGLTR